MSYIITFLAGLICGLLIFRKNSAKLQGIEAQVKQTLDSLKK